MEQWLRYWLSTRSSIRKTTRLHYTTDVERFLIPHMGQLRLSDLDTRRLRAVFAEIAATTNSKGVPQSASCLHHLRTTLRAALNLAVREGVLANNPVRPISQGQLAVQLRVPTKQASELLEAIDDTPIADSPVNGTPIKATR